MTIRWCIIGLLLTASAAAAQGTDGKSLYQSNCKMCHGVAGIPPAPMKKMMPKIPTFDSAFISSRSADSVVKVLLAGTKSMASFKEKLSREEMAAVAKYVHELALKPPGGGLL